MSQREKTLAAIVGGILALLITGFLIKFFLAKQADYNKALASAESGIQSLNKQEGDRAMWKERDEWLNEFMAPVGDPQVANRQLIEAVRDTAKKYTVTLEAPNPGVPNKQANHTSLPLRIEATAEWKSMFDFLDDLQAPGQFMVFESLDLRVDPANKTQLRASMTLAKWFAP